MRIQSGVTALVVIFGVAGCGAGEAKKTLCASNLKELWMLHHAQGKREKGKLVLSSSTGAQFWLDLQSASSSPADLESFVCPLSGRAPAKGVTTYRGPAGDVNTLADSDVVGCCSGHHSDGSLTVVRRDGSVVLVPKGDPAQKQALDNTRP